MPTQKNPNLWRNFTLYEPPPRTLQNNKKHPVGDYNALRYPVSHEVFLCCYLLLCFFLEITSKGNGCYCGNDNTFCNITVKVTLLITIFLCFDSFPNHGSDKPCTNQDTGNSFFGVWAFMLRLVYSNLVATYTAGS